MSGGSRGGAVQGSPPPQKKTDHISAEIWSTMSHVTFEALDFKIFRHAPGPP